VPNRASSPRNRTRGASPFVFDPRRLHNSFDELHVARTISSGGEALWEWREDGADDLSHQFGGADVLLGHLEGAVAGALCGTIDPSGDRSGEPRGAPTKLSLPQRRRGKRGASSSPSTGYASTTRSASGRSQAGLQPAAAQSMTLATALAPLSQSSW
jgi:hypothetical protein